MDDDNKLLILPKTNDSHNYSIHTDLFPENVSVADWIVVSLYIPLIAVAFVANMLIIVIVCKDYHMRSVTNYFLVNLSVADLLVTLICMPNSILHLVKPGYTYQYGQFPCKMSVYLQCISVSSSIFTITAMAIDRYLAIAKPFGLICRCFNKRTTIVVITCLWLTSLILFLPILFVQISVDTGLPLGNEWNSENTTLCYEYWEEFPIPRHVAGTIWFVFLFIVPGVINLFAYSMMGRTLCSVTPPCDLNEGLANRQQHNRVVRDRKRVACILLLLAFVFAGCWLPYQTIQLLKDFKFPKVNEEKYVIILGHLNSALNPIIFCALSKKFRGSIRGLFTVQIRLRRRQAINKWVDSGSGSGTQLHYSLHRIKSIPTVQNQLSLLNFSHQKMNSTPNNHNLKSCNV